MATATITLGSVTFNPNIKWPDKWRAQGVAQSVVETLGGGIVVSAQRILSGQVITLVADDEAGWLTRAQVIAVQAMADDVGAVFTLTINGTAYSVMFRHNEPPAFEASPFIPRLNEDADDYFRATIKLIRV